MNETVYTALAGISFVTLIFCVVVIFRHQFCSPFIVLLVIGISIESFGLLLSGLQRAAQHDDLTIGLAPVMAAQLLFACTLGYLAWDLRWRRHVRA